MLSSLSWVPRGAAITKLPVGVDHNEKNETEDEQPIEDKVKALEIASEEQQKEDEEEGEEGTDQVDINEVLAKDLDTLAFYKKGEKDPNLKENTKIENEIFDDEELDDMNLRSTDSLIVTVKSGEDISSLEVYVFDDNPEESDLEDNQQQKYIPHTYLHHDIILPALPLCTSYKKFYREQHSNNQHINLIAIGMFTPGIDIWDVDQVNNLEPIISLGGYDVKNTLQSINNLKSRQKRKKKIKPKLKKDSHNDAVMSLSWNNVQHEYIASGSADATIKIWDIESSHCATTLTHHNDKVQSISFHPNKSELLASGSFDKSIHISDVRSPSSSINWKVNSDVESVQWSKFDNDDNNYIISTLENGEILIFDSRNANKYLKKWKAHQGATTSCSMSENIPGLMVTSGIDKIIKVWDLNEIISTSSSSSSSSNDYPNIIYQRPSKAGSLFTLQLCDVPETESNASPFVIAYGGSKGNLGVVDLAVESKNVRDRFLQHCQKDAKTVIESRVARNINARKQRLEKMNAAQMIKDEVSMRDEDESNDDNESESKANSSEDEEDED